MSAAVDSARLTRARRLLTDKGAWIEPQPAGAYAMRLVPDRRSRVVMRLSEAEFEALTHSPGLAVRTGGGWQVRRAVRPESAGSPGGAPGRIEALEDRQLPNGTRLPVRVNQGDSAIAWLARRRDAAGRPWLSPQEVAAGLRLTRDAELALKGPSLTQRWDALPRSGGGTAAGLSRVTPPWPPAAASPQRSRRPAPACRPCWTPYASGDPPCKPPRASWASAAGKARRC